MNEEDWGISKLHKEVEELRQKRSLLSGKKNEDVMPITMAIDKELKSLTPTQLEALSRNSDFISNENQIQGMKYRFIMAHFSPQFEELKEGKMLLEQQLNFIRKTKDNIIEEDAKKLEANRQKAEIFDAAYREALKSESDLTVEDFINKLKNTNASDKSVK